MWVRGKEKKKSKNCAAFYLSSRTNRKRRRRKKKKVCLSCLHLSSSIAAVTIELVVVVVVVVDPDSSSFTKSNICSTISWGVVTCHLANVRLLLCPTAVEKIASEEIDNGTAGEDSFPGRSVIAIGACMMMLFSPVGKRSARNMSSSVYGLKAFLLSKIGKKERRKKHTLSSPAQNMNSESGFW